MHNEKIHIFANFGKIQNGRYIMTVFYGKTGQIFKKMHETWQSNCVWHYKEHVRKKGNKILKIHCIFAI